MLANMLARFAIGTNLLGKKKNVEKCWPTFSQTRMLARFDTDSYMLANILDFERLFKCFYSNFEQV